MHATRRCGGGQGRTAVAARGCTKRSLPGGVASGGRRPTVGTAPPAAGELQADASPVNELIWHAIGARGGLVGMWVGLSGGKVRARELGARCGGRIRTPVHPLAGHARSPRVPDISCAEAAGQTSAAASGAQAGAITRDRWPQSHRAFQTAARRPLVGGWVVVGGARSNSELPQAGFPCSGEVPSVFYTSRAAHGAA